MKKYLKRALCIALTIVLTFGILYYLNAVLVLKRTDGITTMQNLYAQEPNTVDVLLLGSSHCGMNLDTEQLWREYGIAGYALWGSVQPFWNTYYFLLEALKTQTPQAVVLETYLASQDFEYASEARQVTNTAGMHYNLNRWRAVCASAPKERTLDLFLGLPLYHQRYQELTKDDFFHFPWSENLIADKGTDSRYGSGAYALTDVSHITQTAPIHPKEEKYLRMIIETCQERQIPILLITTPSANREAEQPYYNSVALIAHEYGVQYCNYNLLDADTGLAPQDYWLDGHVNTNGARKISSHLGRLLQEDYQVSDRRSDPLYDSWNENAIQIQNAYLKQITQTADYFNELTRSGKSVIVVKRRSWEITPQYEALISQFSGVGISEEALRAEADGCWLLSNTQAGSAEEQSFQDALCSFSFDGHTFTVDYLYKTGISFDTKTLYQRDTPGVFCIVYDPNTQTCIDMVTFLASDGFDIRHIALE